MRTKNLNDETSILLQRFRALTEVESHLEGESILPRSRTVLMSNLLLGLAGSAGPSLPASTRIILSGPLAAGLV